MADTQEAPQTAVPDGNAQEGGLIEAQNALLKLQEPVEETPETEEGQPTEEEESQPEEEDESLEEEEEEESEEEDESEPADEEDDEELYAVTVDGEEVGVSLEELMRGYSRQSDYTKKTQQVAEDRREMESLQEKYNSEIAQIQAERNQYVDALNRVVQNTSSELDKYSDIDWVALKESDPIEYVTRRDEYREAQDNIKKIQEEQVAASRRQQFAQKQNYEQVVSAERGKLVEFIPEFADDSKRKAIVDSIQSYAITQGFTSDELDNLVDHRSVVVLDKARKYDEVQKANPKAKKLKNKPRVIRSGSGTTKKDSLKSKRTIKMKRLKQSGHVDDAASLLEDMFNS